MRKRLYLICIFWAVFMLLTTLKVLGAGETFSDLAADMTENERYHPNGSEPVYVGIFGD